MTKKRIIIGELYKTFGGGSAGGGVFVLCFVKLVNHSLQWPIQKATLQDEDWDAWGIKFRQPSSTPPRLSFNLNASDSEDGVFSTKQQAASSGTSRY